MPFNTNKDIYNNYSIDRNWDESFSPSSQEIKLLDKEFKGVNLDGVKLLDIGFGNGALLTWAQQRGAHISGVEIQEELLSSAVEAGIKVFSSLHDVPEASIEIAVLFDVLEHVHIEEVPTFLAEIMRVLEPGGRAILRFPNCQSPAGLANQFGDYTHLSMLSGPIVEFYMKQSGFTDVSFRAARDIESSKFQNRIAKLLLRPVLSLFEYGYRLTFSDRTTLLTPNVFLQAKKSNE